MLNGLLRLNNGGMAFQYLNTDYRISDQAIIQIENQNFDFINFDFRDRIYDTSANISGRISHENFRTWNLDLEVDTNLIDSLFSIQIISPIPCITEQDLFWAKDISKAFLLN